MVMHEEERDSRDEREINASEFLEHDKAIIG